MIWVWQSRLSGTLFCPLNLLLSICSLNTATMKITIGQTNQMRGGALVLPNYDHKPKLRPSWNIVTIKTYTTIATKQLSDLETKWPSKFETQTRFEQQIRLTWHSERNCATRWFQQSISRRRISVKTDNVCQWYQATQTNKWQVVTVTWKVQKEGKMITFWLMWRTMLRLVTKEHV